ncbi:solute carrier family 35 member G2-like [Branchiostoma floridae x Branchiostoma belcheri]
MAAISQDLKAAKGPLLNLLSTVLMALSAEFMTLSHKGGIPGFQLLFLLSVTQFLTVIVFIPCVCPRLVGENLRQNGKLILMTVINVVSSTLMYLSFTYSSPGIEIGIIQGSAPLFTACVGFILLKETVTLIPCCGILISVIGVVLVGIGMGREGSDSTQNLAISILLPLSAALTRAPGIVLFRAVLKDLSGVTIMLYLSALGTVAQFILTYSLETPVWTMSAQTAGYVAGLGLTQALATLTLLGVLDVEKAAIAVAMGTLVVPITILLDYLFLTKVPGLLKWVGLSLVVLGTVVLSIYTWWKHRQEERHQNLLEELNFSPNPALQEDEN